MIFDFCFRNPFRDGFNFTMLEIDHIIPDYGGGGILQIVLLNCVFNWEW